MNDDSVWQQYLTSAIRRAYLRLFETQPNLDQFTSETHQREPNLSFHFANALWPHLPWLNCDFDVIKPNLGSKRPDIIFHRRGTHRFNFLVVEVKRDSEDMAADLTKIMDTWFDGRLNYRFGAAIFLSPETRSAGFRIVSRESRVCMCERDFEGVPDRVLVWNQATATEIEEECREIARMPNDQDALGGIRRFEEALLRRLVNVTEEQAEVNATTRSAD